ncbi:MAG TPA: class I SAM-dependent methyltransferase [Chthoniobacter sp.]|nr:class I SAM-dependent methyltransferase [Chthoniobacter sp.]
MTPRQIAKSYDQIAGRWNANDFDRTNGIAQHRRALQFVSSKLKAIDIGCGSSGRLLDLMIDEGFAVEGVDISPEMIRLARLRHPSVTFHLADICTFEFSWHYDFISAWDSIWHVPLSQHEAVLGNLCTALNPGGVLIFTSGGVEEPNEVTNAFSGAPLYHAALGIPRLLEIVSEHGCICRHLEYDQHPELHIYLIVQKGAALQKL